MTAVERLREALGLNGLRGVLICREAELRWVTGGFAGEGLALVTGSEALLFTDYRCTSGVPEPGIRLIRCKGSFTRALAEECLLLGLERLYFPEEQLPVSRYRRLRDLLDGEIALLPLGKKLQPLMAVKTDAELLLTREACRVTCDALTALLPHLREGITERRAAAILNAALFDLGAEGLAFPTMVAFGERTSLCHPMPGERPLQTGDAVLVDLGCTVGGFAADFSRVLCLGTPDPELIRLHEAVLAAHKAAVAALKPGAVGRDIDAAARETLTALGVSPRYPHATGHGVGTEVHAWPALNGDSRDALQPGMTVAVEPAVYTMRLGVRLEDTLLITPTGS